MTEAAHKPESQKRLDAVRGLSPDHFSTWKHYEDRASQLGAELWSIGSWLAALIGATLSLPFVAKFIEPIAVYPYVKIANRPGTAVVAAFGLCLCAYSYVAMSDVREHIQSNWRKAGYVLEGTWQMEWGGRKSHGWIVLLATGGLAFTAFSALLIAAIV